MRKGNRFSSLSWRLLAAFLAVAVGAVALLTVVAVTSVDRRTATLAATQRNQLRSQIAAALAAAYSAGRGTWTSSALIGVQALAGSHDISVVLLDPAGRPIASYIPGHDTWDMESGSSSASHDSGHDDAATSQHDATTRPSAVSSPSPASSFTHDSSTRASTPSPQPRHDDRSAGEHSEPQSLPAAALLTRSVGLTAGSTPAGSAGRGEQVSVPIVVNGRQVGTAKLTLPSALDPSVSDARAALLRSVWLGAALAVLLAAAAAVFVSRRMSRPLTALTAATRAFAAGDPDADQLVRPGPGEVGELGDAFTTMAASVRRQDELRRAVVADVAHELRTPVTILRGQTEALLDGIADPTPARLVSLHDEVLRLQRLTDDLATLSAADAAGLSLHRETVDFGKLAGATVDAMTSTFADAELNVTVSADDDVTVHADAVRLTQILTNLLSNASKFTPAGGTVTVTVTRGRGDAVLTVRDTGPGIPADELPHLFERFWRGRVAGTRAGTGIGLAVVDTLVTAHGGSVRADSPADGGAAFTVCVPLIPDP